MTRYYVIKKFEPETMKVDLFLIFAVYDALCIQRCKPVFSNCQTVRYFSYIPALCYFGISYTTLDNLRRKLYDRHFFLFNNRIMLEPLGLLSDINLLVTPNTTYCDIEDDKKNEMLYFIRQYGAAIYQIVTMEIQSGLPMSSVYKTIKKIDYFSEEYEQLRNRFFDFFDDHMIPKFINTNITFSELVLEAKKELCEYVQVFVRRVRKKMKEKTGNRYPHIKYAVDRYLCFLSRKNLKDDIMLQEIFNKLNSIIFSGDRGIKLAIEMLSPELGDGTVLIKIRRNYMKCSDRTSMKSDEIIEVYEKYGETVATELLRLSYIEKDKTLAEIMTMPRIRSLIEKEEKKAKMIGDRLIEEEEKRKRRRKKKGKKEVEEKEKGKRRRRKKGKKEVENRSEEDIEEMEECVEEVIMEYCESMSDKITSKYRCAKRVRRWRRSVEEIKEHLDACESKKYAGQSIEEITDQKDIHDLGPVVRILEEEDSKDYFFNTEKGKSAFAELEVNERRRKGILEIGIDEERKAVYHLMFNPRNTRIEDVLNIIHPTFHVEEETEEWEGEDNSSEGGPFKCPRGCIVMKYHGVYIVKYVDPEDDTVVHKALYIYPYRDTASY